MDQFELAKQWAPFVTIIGVVITLLWKFNKGIDGKIHAAIKEHKEEIRLLTIAEDKILELKLENLYGKMRGRLNSLAKVNSLMAGQVKTLHETQVFKREDEDAFNETEE